MTDTNYPAGAIPMLGDPDISCWTQCAACTLEFPTVDPGTFHELCPDCREEFERDLDTMANTDPDEYQCPYEMLGLTPGGVL